MDSAKKEKLCVLVSVPVDNIKPVSNTAGASFFSVAFFVCAYIQSVPPVWPSKSGGKQEWQKYL